MGKALSFRIDGHKWYSASVKFKGVQDECQSFLT